MADEPKDPKPNKSDTDAVEKFIATEGFAKSRGHDPKVHPPYKVLSTTRDGNVIIGIVQSARDFCKVRVPVKG